MNKNKIIEYFIRKAEIGDWEKTTIHEAETKLKFKKNKIIEFFKEKEAFLAFYFEEIDKRVLKSVNKEDFKISNPEEILQEFLMNKLELMNNHKLGISNIINYYICNPKFLLLNLKTNKSSIENFLSQFKFKNNILKKKLLIKLILTVWLLAFRSWLYENHENSISYSIIDKGFKRIKKSTKLLDIVIKK